MKTLASLPVARMLVAVAIVGIVATGTAAAGQDVPSGANAPQSPPPQTVPADAGTGTATDVGPQVDVVQTPQDVERGQSVAAPTLQRSEDPLSFELGVMPRSISNYFESQDEFNTGSTVTPAQSAHIVTASASLSYNVLQTSGSTLATGLRVRENFFTNFSNADSTDVDATLGLKGKSSQLNLGYFTTRHRLVSISNGDDVYDDSNGFTVEYLRNLTKRLRVRARYRFAHENYSQFKERNLTEDEFSGDLRYKISPYFMPGVGYDYTRTEVASGLYYDNRYAPFVTVTSEIGKLAYLSFRYRSSVRHYIADLTTDSHYGRRDKRDQFTFYGTVWLGHGISVFAYEDYIKNNSNVIYDNFKTNEVGLGLFYRFD